MDDDLAAVLEWMREADLLVLASPVYYGDVTSQLKGFIDRTFSFLRPEYYCRPDPSRLEPGKKLLFLFSQGNSAPYAFDDIFYRYERFFKVYGYAPVRQVRALGVYGPKDAANKEQLVETVRKTAQELLGQGLSFPHNTSDVLPLCMQAGKQKAAHDPYAAFCFVMQPVG